MSNLEVLKQGRGGGTRSALGREAVWGGGAGGDRVEANIFIGRMGLSLQVGEVAGGIRASGVDRGEPQNWGPQGSFGQTWASLQRAAAQRLVLAVWSRQLVKKIRKDFPQFVLLRCIESSQNSSLQGGKMPRGRACPCSICEDVVGICSPCQSYPQHFRE